MDSFNNNDAFKQFVKGKLADYKQEVPPNGWEELEKSILASQKTKVMHTRWLASSVAAVAAALIGVFFLFQNTKEELSTLTTETKTEKTQTPSKKEEKSLITKQSQTRVEATATPLLADNASKLQQTTHQAIVTENKVQPALTVSDKSLEAKEDIASEREESTIDKKRTSDIDDEKRQQMIQDFINQGKESSSIIDDTKQIKRKNRFAISLSGRSGLSSQQNNTLPSTLRASVSDSYGMFTMSKMQAYNEDEKVNPESETTHKQPISLGVLTSFNITPKMQIETGLIYTHLSSETTNRSESFTNTEKVQFHYLGVPLNINYTLLSVNKLNLFVTAGTMVEKDINGKIRYNDEKDISSVVNGGYANESYAKINQKNPQWSIAGGVGITYPLYHKTHLFGKVGGRYYINANNEYKTYYSDEKLGLDIQVGIKFNF